MSGRSARSIRNFSLELGQDLVLLDVRKSTFQHFTVNWNLNVLEIVSKPSILSRVSPEHLYYFSSISHHQIFQNDFPNKQNLENRTSGNLKSKNPGSLTSAQEICERMVFLRALGYHLEVVVFPNFQIVDYRDLFFATYFRTICWCNINE